MKRWAIYARYSSERQNPKSIDDQVRECQAAIAAKGETAIARAFSDAGASGAHAAQRPGYLSLRDAIKARAIDAVMAEDTDRYARQLEEMARLYAVADYAGVELWTIADGQVTQLHTGLKGLMGELYLKAVAEKTRRGLIGVVKRGGIPGGRCYGYDVTGKAGRAINEEQAAIVTRIYDEYASGKSPRAICRDLNREGVAGPRGGIWRVSTVIGNAKRLNGTLNNPIYIGRLAFNRQSFRKDPETGKRQARGNPQDQWIYEDHPELAIVGMDLWQRVARRRQGLSTGLRPEAYRRPVSLLSGLVRCAACGAPMAKSGPHFRCTDQMNGGSCANGRGRRVDELERITVEAFQAALNDAELIAHFRKVFEREVALRLKARAGDRAGARRRLEEIERKIGNLARALESGLESDAVSARLKALEAQRRSLAAVVSPPGPRAGKGSPPAPDVPALFRAASETLGESLKAPTDTGRRMREAFRSTIAQIRTGPGKDGRQILEVDGSIQGLLQVAGSPENVDNGGCGNPHRTMLTFPMVRIAA